MLITKFNRMIRNRWLWAGFAVIISASFLGVGLSMKGCDDAESRGRSNAAGRLYDGDVLPQEFNLARYFEIGLREMPELTDEDRETLRKRTWHRLAALKTAEQMGIVATDSEIKDAIAMDPSFTDENGGFNPMKYRYIIGRVLGNSANAEQIFQDYLRQRIIMQKLQDMIATTIWISPSELNQKIGNLTDTFVVEFAILSTNDHTGDVTITEDDANTFYLENPDLFRIPEKVAVGYAEFPISNYLAKVEINEDEVLDYYDMNQDSFLVPATNSDETAGSESNALDDPLMAMASTNDDMVALPLEEVTEEITTILRRRAAISMAQDVATDMVMALAPNRYGKATPLDTALDRAGLELQTTSLFSAYEDIPGVAAGYDFREAAFGLDASDPEAYFSDAVEGDESIFVLIAEARQDSFVPEFESVSEKANEYALASAKYKAFTENVEKLRNEVETGLEDDKTLAEAISPYGLNVITTETFTVYGGMASNEHEQAQMLLRHVVNLQAGALTDVVETQEGGILGYVTARLPADANTRQMFVPEILKYLSRDRTEAAFREWGEYLLTVANFEDLNRSDR